jgi:hypothetical protein
MLRSGVLIFFLSLLNPIPLCASGNYYVGKDAGGVYLQTDQDGGWYIDREDLRFFKIGDSGTYSIGKDVAGTYLSTDENRKYYLDMEAEAKLVKETGAFNASEEKRLRDLREEANKRRQEAKDKEAADKGDKQAPQPVRVEITVTSQGYDENNRRETYIGPGFYPYRRPMPHHRPEDPSSLKAPSPEPPTNTRLGSSGHVTEKIPWWKGSPYPRYWSHLSIFLGSKKTGSSTR